MEATSQSVIESLADKLAAADLTDAEIDLLRTLLADDDVAGFSTGNWGSILSAGASTKGWSWGTHITGIKAPTPATRAGDGSV